MPDTETRFYNLAMMCGCEALKDLATLMQKDEGGRDQAVAGGIAIGFERAAAAMRQKAYQPQVDPKHENIKGTLG